MTLDEFSPVILNLGVAENVSGWNYHGVSSPFARLYFILSGGARVVIGGRSWDLVPGKIYMIPPFTVHDEVCETTFSHYYIHVYETPSSCSLFERFDFPVAVEATENDRLMFEQLLKNAPGRQLEGYDPESYGKTSDIISNIRSEKEDSLFLRMQNRGLLFCLFARFLANASVRQSKGGEQVKAAISYINDNISDPLLSVDDLACKACLSVNQFIRRFTSETGVTPLQYITNRRIEKAQLLLLGNGASVKSVSIAVGFRDPAYFCKVFKRRTGISPHQFREYSMKNY